MPKQRDPLSIYVGDLLAEKRKAQKMSRNEVGEQLGVTGSAIWYYEKGRSQLHLRQFIRLCTILGVDAAELISTLIEGGVHLLGQSDGQHKK